MLCCMGRCHVCCIIPGERQLLSMALAPLAATQMSCIGCDSLPEQEIRSAARSAAVNRAAAMQLQQPNFDDNMLQAHGADAHDGHGIALVVDAEVTSYLMMGALSPGLKRHSVTLFEGQWSQPLLHSSNAWVAIITSTCSPTSFVKACCNSWCKHAAAELLKLMDADKRIGMCSKQVGG